MLCGNQGIVLELNTGKICVWPFTGLHCKSCLGCGSGRRPWPSSPLSIHIHSWSGSRGGRSRAFRNGTMHTVHTHATSLGARNRSGIDLMRQYTRADIRRPLRHVHSCSHLLRDYYTCLGRCFAIGSWRRAYGRKVRTVMATALALGMTYWSFRIGTDTNVYSDDDAKCVRSGTWWELMRFVFLQWLGCISKRSVNLCWHRYSCIFRLPIMFVTILGTEPRVPSPVGDDVSKLLF